MNHLPIVQRLIDQLKARNDANPAENAIALLKKDGILHPDGSLTELGHHRQSMTPAERAIDRAVRYSKGAHRHSDYLYHEASNRAVLRRKKK